ncbi:MAG: DUF1841 family protein [Methylococcales bacterium]|jgi:hypothetical protein|nr:DUF1841 family protein [Methylococcales bacterium]MBT7410735.1 DUF1841 family protein [Methylococcales bacterium]
MQYFQNREEMRQFYCECWRKHQQQEICQPIEQQIIGIMLLHPEYHSFFEQNEQATQRDFHPQLGETNPFLHIALHLTLAEQIQTDKLKGLKTLYENICRRKQDSHIAEHLMIECLSSQIWETQHNQTTFDDKKYLRCLRKLLK